MELTDGFRLSAIVFDWAQHAKRRRSENMIRQAVAFTSPFRRSHRARLMASVSLGAIVAVNRAIIDK